ncbi:uncharacterized protein Z518_00191 [Rhinocladiella mackenziei CBS 650.93]|uniref:Uncharacterized protein n=1 Tax=Rhinocladiella mackenziei CBS 650.93 TaxID=1442369 RepID=A0A0D2HEQ4_9EURO|nr:uncharacterized protein Z518_00191 [Rhinocladiella mackenziei CBS 650.93]KIX09113.1 hypothetical protein Z518_00191 [Rhinocladiella mackenziei CBS 650.93]
MTIHLAMGNCSAFKDGSPTPDHEAIPANQDEARTLPAFKVTVIPTLSIVSWITAVMRAIKDSRPDGALTY